MKNLKYSILFFIGVFLIQSCLQEEEDIFGKSGAERLNDAQKYYEKVLTAAPNGWLLEYIAGDTDANRRGAFNFLLKFENGEVTASVDGLAMSDINPTNENIYEKKTSLYRFDQDLGVTLSFSSYNSFLHYYHEQHGSYTTYKGDFEFSIMEANDDLVVLRGKKYGNIMEMHRFSPDITWEKYLEEVNTIVDLCDIYSNFELLQNNQKIGTGSTNSNYRYTFSTTEDQEIASNAIFTPTGIKFITPLSINGQEAQFFDWDDTNKEYICTDDGLSVKIVPVLDPFYIYYEQFIGTYTLKYNNNLTTTVTIEKKTKGKSFTLKGLTDFEIELVFSKMNGTASLLTQDVGKSGGYTVSLNPWDTSAGYLTWGVGIGMVSILNEKKQSEEGILEFMLIDNDTWKSYKANGFLLRLYDSILGSHSNATYKGYYGGESRFYNFIFTKQ